MPLRGPVTSTPVSADSSAAPSPERLPTLPVRHCSGADCSGGSKSDLVTINDLTGTSIRRVHVDLSGSDGMGDQQPDVVTVNGTDQADDIGVLESSNGVAVKGLSALTDVSGGESTDQLQIDALGGNDSVNVTQTAATPIGIHVDLGAS